MVEVCGSVEPNGQDIFDWLPSTAMRECKAKAGLGKLLTLKLEDAMSNNREVHVNRMLSVNRFGDVATCRQNALSPSVCVDHKML